MNVFINTRSHGTLTSFRVSVVHYGTFVHPQNNMRCVTLIRTIVVHYGRWFVWSCVISALYFGRFIDIVRFSINNRLMALALCQNFVNIYPTLRYLNATVVLILILLRPYSMLK